MQHLPEKIFEDEDGNMRIFDEMWTGDWRWNVQVSTMNSGRRSYKNSLDNVRNFFPQEQPLHLSSLHLTKPIC